MTHPQRYVSKELTHFTGKHCKKPSGAPDEEAQYSLLIKILRDGFLLHRTDHQDVPARLTIDGEGSFEKRTLIRPDAVYFCDIPVADFGIHINKYSAFGLSFLKSFLVEKGANPAFYVAHDSTVSPVDPAALLMYSNSPRPDPLTRGALMDRLIKSHLSGATKLRNAALIENIPHGVLQAEIAGSEMLASMIRFHFLSFCVPFDSTKDDTDEENYYMEREWRILGKVRFSLGDVCRVVLPRRYAESLRRDVAGYIGQITFSDY